MSVEKLQNISILEVAGFRQLAPHSWVSKNESSNLKHKCLLANKHFNVITQVFFTNIFLAIMDELADTSQYHTQRSKQQLEIGRSFIQNWNTIMEYHWLLSYQIGLCSVIY